MTIFPEASEAKEVAKLLLELADHPSQVSTTLDPGLGFVVPEWLYQVFVETWDLKLGKADDVSAPEVNVDEFAAQLRTELAADGKDTADLDRFIVARLETEMVIAESEPAPETPARRKPGRPRKES